MRRDRPAAVTGAICALLSIVAFVVAAQQKPQWRIRVTPKEAERRVDITIDGKPFTSYIWPDTLKKPVLFPLRSAQGTIVTRGFPLEPRAGERVDHPHHAGMWFNYGDVNGLDFWNNSDAIKPEQRPKMGTILHRKIVATTSGNDKGELSVEMEWVNAEGKALLLEQTRFVFAGDSNSRTIDRITTLTALDEKVAFTDNKEGVIGIRVARSLEMPSDKPEIFTDASGRPTAVAKMDNTGVSGNYLTSEGKTGDAAWGTPGRWCILTGTVSGDPVTMAIFDHPKNPGFPTYWHARGYGLFAANPLGRAVFSNGKEALNFQLAPKASATFQYRVVIASGTMSPENAEAVFKAFSQTTPVRSQ